MIASIDGDTLELTGVEIDEWHTQWMTSPFDASIIKAILTRQALTAADPATDPA